MKDWPWSSLRERREPAAMPGLVAGPLPRPADWTKLVNEPQTETELARLRESMKRGSPSGGAGWTKRTVSELGLEFALRGVGRPRREPSELPLAADQGSLFAEQ